MGQNDLQESNQNKENNTKHILYHALQNKYNRKRYEVTRAF